MNWVFAIIPLTDFDPVHGPFLVSPKSHKLTRVIDEEAHILDVNRPDASQLPDFIDPELKAGDLLVETTRLLIECPDGGESKFLLRRDADTNCWELPGGEGWEEEALVGWDVGARVGSLQALTRTQLGLEVPWMSYIEDVEEGDGVCRVYGFSDENLNVDALANGHCDWFTRAQIQQLLGESDAISRVVELWQRADIIRGKGKACNQSRNQFE